MAFDFDKVVDRKNTFAAKMATELVGASDDVLPLWVADMDFPTAPYVIKAMQENADFGIFGYAQPNDDYFDPIIKWMKKNFDWTVNASECTYTPGVVPAINVAVRAFTEPGDAVIIQTPVYFPFLMTINGTGRKMVTSDLINKDGKGYYEIDFDDFEKKIIDNDVKLFILCSPHNPVGRVWTKDELTRMGEICLKHGVVVVADEIHMDFVFSDHKHTVFATLSDEFDNIAITCTAPSKTFNLAGLGNSNIFIRNKDMLARFNKEYENVGMPHMGQPGLIACKAAYEGGQEWLDELRVYLKGNIDLIAEYAEKWDGIHYTKPEGTYLSWFDCSEIAKTDAELDDLFLNKAKVWLNLGSPFGSGGEGHVRMNAASPRSVIKEGLDRITAALG
ncbi:MAG: pyridoxal phosphate-dependent aminotransferase [Clostridiales Family XIII bacterium]|jgi:cystathionine beta-lyase|nr:pyridoxal phosphate-dependent aminotransferase [Clostridiales Family XIII bacterium]